MFKIKTGSENAILVLHEIYGINPFIKDICKKYSKDGFDVFCPNLTRITEPFAYSQQEEAYRNFTKNVGFGVYRKVNAFLEQLRPEYKTITLLGFSVGATIAWRCAESGLCDRVVGCYGLRIRDYPDVAPKCPCLLLFADKEPSFDVESVAKILSGKANTDVKILSGCHGFCDAYSQNYAPKSAQKAEEFIADFLQTAPNSLRE